MGRRVGIKGPGQGVRPRLPSSPAAAAALIERMQKVARTAASVLKNGRRRYRHLGDAEICCGARAYDLGYREGLWPASPRPTSRPGPKLESRPWLPRAPIAIGLSSGSILKRAGAGFEVLHTVEFIDRLIKQGRDRVHPVGPR